MRGLVLLDELPLLLACAGGTLLWLLLAPWLRAPRGAVGVEALRVLAGAAPVVGVALPLASWWWFDVEESLPSPASLCGTTDLFLVPPIVAGALSIVAASVAGVAVLRALRPVERDASPGERLRWSAWTCWLVGTPAVIVGPLGLCFTLVLAGIYWRDVGALALPACSLVGSAFVGVGVLGVTALERAEALAREARAAAGWP